MNRRDVLKLAAAAATSELLRPLSLEARPRAQNELLAYGLFFDDVDIERMRHLFSESGRFASLRERMLAFDRVAERRFIKEEVRYNDQLFHIARLGNSAEEMAFLYLMTGDEDAADLAADLVRTMMKFQRWDFFLEGGKDVVGVQRAPSSTIAVSLVSDWLGPRITPEERADWITTMGRRGCEPCYVGLYGIRNPREVVGWGFDETSTFFEHRPGNNTDMSRRPEITATTNLRAVPAGALTIGALTYRQEFGDGPDVRRWLEMATFSLEEFNRIFRPDGSYHEGVSYGNYTATHLAQATTILERFGEKNVLAKINWEGYARYIVNMAMPTDEDPYDIVNFGDNGNPKSGERGAVTRTAVPYWIGRRYLSGLAQWFADERGGDPDFWALIWYDETVRAVRPEAMNRLWISDLDWVTARTGFNPRDLVVGLRSGAPGNHEHADRNALIVKCFGEQLVTDPYRPPYSYSDPAWPMRLTIGHSAVLIDGKGHEYHNGVEGTNASTSYARLVDSGTGSGYAFWVSEATQPYRLVDVDVKFVARTVIVLYEAPAVVVIDRMTKYSTPSQFQARYFGYNYDGRCRQETSGSDFVTSRPGVLMKGRVLSTVPTHAAIGRLPIPDEIADRHPFVEIGTIEPAMEATVLTGLSIARTDDSIPGAEIVRSDNGFEISFGRIQISIGEDGKIVDQST